MLSGPKTALASQGACFIIMAVCFLSPCVSVSQNLTMSCPAVQIGQEGRNIICVTGADARSISLSRNAITLVQCNTATCSGDQGYRGLVTVNNTNLILSMTIDSVQVKDESVLTCNVDFDGESMQENVTCMLFIFVPPEKPMCHHTFNESHALITCSTAKVYPRAACHWNASSVPQVKLGIDSHPLNVSKDSVFLFNTTCTAVFPVTNQTEYALHVSFFPAGLKEEDISGGVAVETQDIVITVEPPKGPPSLSVSPNREQYVESDNVTISCSVHGGRPLVYRTTLECDRGLIDIGSGSNNVTVQGQVAQMSVQLHDGMQGQSCTCSGSHVSSAYHLQNKLKFWGEENFEGSNETQRSNSSQGPGPLSKYTLNVTSGHNEPPVCPKNLKVKLTLHNTASLSWTYDSRDGVQRTFTIFSHDETMSRDNRTKVAEVSETRGDDVEYNMTGLSRLTRYAFSVEVRNNAGEKTCPEVRVNVTTGAGEAATIVPISRSGPSEALFIISIGCLLIPAIITIVIIVIIVRRRQGGYATGIQQEKKKSENICNKELFLVKPGGPAPSASTGDLVIVGPKFDISDFEMFKLRPQVNRKPRGELSDCEKTHGKTADELDRRLTDRKGSGEGSAYFNVEINPTSKNPVIREKSGAEGSYRVEYLTLSKSNVSVGDDVTGLTYNNTWLTL